MPFVLILILNLFNKKNWEQEEKKLYDNITKVTQENQVFRLHIEKQTLSYRKVRKTFFVIFFFDTV